VMHLSCLYLFIVAIDDQLLGNPTIIFKWVNISIVS